MIAAAAASAKQKQEREREREREKKTFNIILNPRSVHKSNPHHHGLLFTVEVLVIDLTLSEICVSEGVQIHLIKVQP